VYGGASGQNGASLPPYTSSHDPQLEHRSSNF
jgi:hypothetical protein